MTPNVISFHAFQQAVINFQTPKGLASTCLTYNSKQLSRLSLKQVTLHVLQTTLILILKKLVPKQKHACMDPLRLHTQHLTQGNLWLKVKGISNLQNLYQADAAYNYCGVNLSKHAAQFFLISQLITVQRPCIIQHQQQALSLHVYSIHKQRKYMTDAEVCLSSHHCWAAFHLPRLTIIVMNILW